MEPEILFPEIVQAIINDVKISRANTRSRRRLRKKEKKIRSLKAAGCIGDEAVKMGPSSSEQFDAPPQQAEDDASFSSEKLFDAPPPPITSSSLNSGKFHEVDLPEKKRIRRVSPELVNCSYHLRSRRNAPLPDSQMSKLLLAACFL